MAVEKEHEQRRRNKIVLRDPTLPNRFLWLQIIKDIVKKMTFIKRCNTYVIIAIVRLGTIILG